MGMWLFPKPLLPKQDLSCPEVCRVLLYDHLFTTPHEDDQNMQMYTLMTVTLLRE